MCITDPFVLLCIAWQGDDANLLKKLKEALPHFQTYMSKCPLEEKKLIFAKVRSFGLRIMLKPSEVEKSCGPGLWQDPFRNMRCTFARLTATIVGPVLRERKVSNPKFLMSVEMTHHEKRLFRYGYLHCRIFKDNDEFEKAKQGMSHDKGAFENVQQLLKEAERLDKSTLDIYLAKYAEIRTLQW